MVKWTGKLAVLMLALSVWASPLVACMLPDAALTSEERECCRTMAGQCGEMDMPSSHSCCTVTVRETDPYLIHSRFAPGHSFQMTAVLLDATNDISLLQTFWEMESSTPTHSPPASPPASVSILRI